MPTKEEGSAAPEGAKVGHEAPAAFHEPRRPIGWQLWGTAEEAIWISRRSIEASLAQRRETYWGIICVGVQRQAEEYGLPQLVAFEWTA